MSTSLGEALPTLRLICGDQLNIQHHWFREVLPHVTYIMMEIRSETDTCVHHIQKVVAFFQAMRCFATELKAQGHTVLYLDILNPENQQAFSANIQRLVAQNGYQKFEYLLPDEYRVDQELQTLANELGIAYHSDDTEHFYTSRYELKTQFKSAKSYLMESFYRSMRRKHNILMDHGKPIGGQWNFDKQNRKKLPQKQSIPTPFAFQNDICSVLKDIRQAGIITFGEIDAENFQWPVSRAQALASLAYFCDHLLIHFGTYQDAMSTQNTYLFHSRLSFALNVKLISPHEVIQQVIHTWEQKSEQISLAQVEGFVRQILGWREFMRGVYWAQMPDYAHLNYFSHTRPLPHWYWSGNTKMNCLQHAIRQSLQDAYAHHIQRLMITGNFALLAGIDPNAVDAWYLGIYIDALEWVEITNTRGMSQFADGGIIASKPYVSTANYIDKMSDYCGSCFYKAKQKTGERACPFNALYWHFHHRHHDRLQGNPRISMMYQLWNRMEHDEQQALLKQADYYLNHLEDL